MQLIAHNNRTGMFDYRLYDPVPCGRALQVLTLLQQVVDGIVVNPERALEEVRADYSTTTEIADALMQRADVPFRTGHHFASKLTDYGRGLPPPSSTGVSDPPQAATIPARNTMDDARAKRPTGPSGLSLRPGLPPG